MLRLFSVLCRVAAAGRWLSGCGVFCLPLLGLLLRFVAWAVGSVFFVRLPRPALPWLPWRVARCCAWVCVAPAVVRASSPCCFVAPALVVRFGRCRGLVLRCWVFAPRDWGPESAQEEAAVAAGCGGFAAAPAAIA